MTRIAGLGLRVKTAKAIAVGLSGTARAPELVIRRQLTLWDPRVPESAQPYHAGLGLEKRDADRVVGSASRAVRKVSKRAFAELVEELEDAGMAIRGVGLVRASDTDPGTIRNPHMHAHAAEGALFHLALAEAAEAAGRSCFELLVASALAEAAERLRTNEATLSAKINAFGKQVGPPWRADEKAACAAAWIALAS